MKRKALKFLITLAVALSVGLISLSVNSAQNSNSSTGQMKQGGSEVGKAGKSMGRNVRHGRLAKGGNLVR